MNNSKAIIKEYRQLLVSLPEKINSSGYKDIHIMQKMGMKKDLYYRRKKNPALFSLDELERLFEIIDK